MVKHNIYLEKFFSNIYQVSNFHGLTKITQIWQYKKQLLGNFRNHKIPSGYQKIYERFTRCKRNL